MPGKLDNGMAIKIQQDGRNDISIKHLFSFYIVKQDLRNKYKQILFKRQEA